MSDFLAPASVTAILKWTLTNALAGSGLDTVFGTQAGVSALPPDRVLVGNTEKPQVNLFMYHVSSNPAWRNMQMPSRDSSGQPVNNPALALNLHYLLSAYGKNEFDAEILLGWAMQILHDTPVLTRDFVQNALAAMAAQPGATTEEKALANTTFPNQPELARVTPQVLSTEDIYKLWTAFHATYRTTAAYQVSVVLIQRTAAVRAGLPVQTRNILVRPSPPPVIDHVEPALVATGETLTIIGRDFIADDPADTMLLFDGGIAIVPDLVQGHVARLKLPATLPAGTRSVQVTRNVRFGSAGDPHAGVRSGAALFTLLPSLFAPPASVAAGSVLTLTINPPVLREQSAAVLIGGSAIEIDKRPASAPASSSTLAFPIPVALPHPPPPAGLPIRVRIDGAESRLTLDPNPGPTQGQFLPQITVTP